MTSKHSNIINIAFGIIIFWYSLLYRKWLYLSFFSIVFHNKTINWCLQKLRWRDPSVIESLFSGFANHKRLSEKHKLGKTV